MISSIGGSFLTTIGAVTMGYFSATIHVSAFQTISLLPSLQLQSFHVHEIRNKSRLFLSTYHHHHDVEDDEEDETIFTPNDWLQENGLSRRTFGERALGNAIIVGGILMNIIIATPLDPSQWAAKAEEEAKADDDTKTMEEIVSKLRKVPTFAIVDKRGVPFTVFGEDAKLTAYFFTSYQEADRVLRLADISSTKGLKDLKQEINDKRRKNNQPRMTKEEEKEEVGINPWKDARISTVPLDFAVTLASKGKLGGAYFKIAPSKDDIKDALDIDKSVDDLSEGKVPLFYFENFELPTTYDKGQSTNSKEKKKQIPLFFQKTQLLEEWKKQNPTDKLPEIQVTELFSVLSEMVRSNKNANERDEDLDYLTFIPPMDSYMMEKKCVRNGGKEQPYILGERIVVL